MVDYDSCWEEARGTRKKYDEDFMYETEFLAVTGLNDSYETFWYYSKTNSGLIYTHDQTLEFILLDILPSSIEYNDLWTFISDTRGYGDYIATVDFDFQFRSVEYDNLFSSTQRLKLVRYNECEAFEMEFQNLMPQYSLQEVTHVKKKMPKKVNNGKPSDKLKSMLEDRIKRLKLMDTNISAVRKDGKSYALYYCKQCGFMSRRKRNLFVSHIIPVHLRKSKPKQQQKRRKLAVRVESSVARTYLCSFLDCSKKFTTRFARKRHILQIHHGIVRFNCSLCDRKFRDGYSLLRHKKLRHRIRFHECGICNYKSNRKFNLTRHYQKIHHQIEPSGEKSYECPTCAKRFTALQYLRKHREIHDAIGIGYSCLICGFEKAESHKCKFVCQECFREYSTSFDLSVHKKLHSRLEKLRLSVMSREDLTYVRFEMSKM